MGVARLSKLDNKAPQRWRINAHERTSILQSVLLKRMLVNGSESCLCGGGGWGEGDAHISIRWRENHWETNFPVLAAD